MKPGEDEPPVSLERLLDRVNQMGAARLK
jgi:hypothetical protein